MSKHKESWTCGDCGTKYSSDIPNCTNPELDRKMMQRYQDGLAAGKIQKANELNKPIDDLVAAIKILAQYNLVAVPYGGTL